jgi:hypothetical protein
MSKDTVEKIQVNKPAAAIAKLDFTRKVDSGTMIMSIQKDLMRVHDFAMSQDRSTTYVLADFNIQLKAVVSQEADKTMFVLPSRSGELDPNLMSLININLRPIPMATRPTVNSRPVEAIEGIGLTIAARLREIGVSTLTDLARASSAEVQKVGVSAKRASEFISMAKLMTKSSVAGVDGVDEQVAELIVVGSKIDSKEALAQANPTELLKTLTAALESGKVKLPAKYRYTLEDTTRWVESAKIIVERNRVDPK